MSKRILIVSEVFFPESTMLNDFVKELVLRGFDVEVLTQHPSYPYGKVFAGYTNDEYCIEEWNNIKIHRFKVVEGYKESKLKKILNYWTFVYKGKQIVKTLAYKYDHILVYQTGPLTLALPAITLKKRLNVKLTIWTFDIWPDAVYAYGFPSVFPLRQFLDRLIKYVYRNADNILVSSEMFKSSILDYVPNRIIGYAPNWLVDENLVESNIRFDSTKFNFTFTGNISRAQNLENVIKGWKLANIGDKAALNIIGDGSYISYLKSLVISEKIDGVAFHGRLPSNEMQSVMSKSDMLILSLISDPGISKTEPFKLQSYLQSGKPIFGVIQGAGKDIIVENNLGICVNPNSILDIANGYLLSIDFARKNNHLVAEKSSTLLEIRFSKEKTIGKILSLF